MSSQSDEVKARSRALMRRACELGARDFDPKENLVRLTRTDVPAYGGCVVGHTSLEYAIALFETKGDVARARRIIHRILDLQVRDECGIGHGNFPFMSHWDDVHDPNAVCFLVPNLVYVWTRHRRQLDPRLCKRLTAAWPLCTHALNRHRVTRDYSNIYLLSVLSKFLLAPLLPRSDLDRDARVQWRDWVYHTARYGLVEYNSPTYLPVCLYALERLWTFGPADLQEQVGRVLEYLYFEFAARYHAPSGYLSGAMSRAYPNDMRLGHSNAALVAHRQWGTPCEPDSPMIVNWLLGEYVAPPFIRRIALNKKYPLAIRADVSNIGITRTDYITRDFALGSQTGNWCHIQEVPLFVAVRGEASRRCVFIEPSLPQAARFVSQQKENEVVGIYSFDPVSTRYFCWKRNIRPMNNLPKNLDFTWQLGPRDLVSEVWLNGKRWNSEASTLSNEIVLAAKLGNACLGLRLQVHTGGRTGGFYPMRLTWENDELILKVTVCTDAKAHADRGVAGAMAFYLRMSSAANVTCRGMLWKLKGVSLKKAKAAQIDPAVLHAIEVSGRTSTLAATTTVPPVLHQSKLAKIYPDDLLDFFCGRAPAPWKISR